MDPTSKYNAYTVLLVPTPVAVLVYVNHASLDTLPIQVIILIIFDYIKFNYHHYYH